MTLYRKNDRVEIICLDSSRTQETLEGINVGDKGYFSSYVKNSDKRFCWIRLDGSESLHVASLDEIQRI